MRLRIKGFGLGFRLGLGLSESRESLGRSSCSWLEDEEESDKREDEMETDSQSESFNNGRLKEWSNDDDEELQLQGFELLCRKCFNDFGLELVNEEENDNEVLWVVVSVLWLEFWYNFFNPKSSFHRLEHLGAFGENKYESEPAISISILRQVFAASGDLISVADDKVFMLVTCSGTSFPSEKSSSAGSIVTGSSRRNSKSTGSWSTSGEGSSEEADAAAVLEDPECLEGSSSRLKEIRGLNHPYDG